MIELITILIMWHVSRKYHFKPDWAGFIAVFPMWALDVVIIACILKNCFGIY